MCPVLLRTSQHADSKLVTKRGRESARGEPAGFSACEPGVQGAQDSTTEQGPQFLHFSRDPGVYC